MSATYLPLSIGPVKAIIVFGAVNFRLLAGALMADIFMCDAYFKLFVGQKKVNVVSMAINYRILAVSILAGSYN